MKATPRIVIQLMPSHWRLRLNICCALLLGLATALVLHDLVLLSSWILCAALANVAALAFTFLARRQNAKLGSEKRRLILAQARQVWIGQEGAPPLDAPLPELSKLQRYLGLIWLRNSAGVHALIWPDSISADEHRQLRVWLGIHVHRNN